MLTNDSTLNEEKRNFSQSTENLSNDQTKEEFDSSKTCEEKLHPIRDGKVPRPDDERKLFVGQLSSDITKEDLEKYFAKFGSIEDVTIKYDVPGGRARGFAFILFDQKESIEKVLNVPQHFINQCQIDPKQAHRRPPVTNPVKKIFIGQLPTDFVEQDLTDYFSQFGIVDTIELPMDRGKSVRRPFGFVSFSSEKTAEEVLRQQRHSINGTFIEVRPAKPRPHEQHQQQQQQHHHQHHQQQQQQHYQFQQPQQFQYGEYLLHQHHSNPMISSVATPQSMINVSNNPNSYYQQAMNNNNQFNGQVIDQWTQGTNHSAAYWTNNPTEMRSNTNHHSVPQWSTGTNAGLPSMSGNSNVYPPLGNSSSSSSTSAPTVTTTIYPTQNGQTPVFNPNGLTSQMSFSSSNYSNPVQSSFNLSAGQSTSNVYPTGYSSSSTSNDLQSSSSSATSWNQYQTIPHLLNGTANNYDPNLYYTTFYPGFYPHQYYSPAAQQQQQATLGVNPQSQSGLTMDQTVSSNGPTTSSNGNLDKNYQHHSR